MIHVASGNSPCRAVGSVLSGRRRHLPGPGAVRRIAPLLRRRMPSLTRFRRGAPNIDGSTGMDNGLYGQLWLGLLALAGGVAGTCAAVAGTSGREARRFVIRVCAALWLGALTFVAGGLMLPRPFGFILIVPYGVVLAVAANRWQKQWLQLNQGDDETRDG